MTNTLTYSDINKCNAYRTYEGAYKADNGKI
jgi:hypothetical protein